jgi:virulence factor
VAIVDTDLDKARSVAALYGCRAVASIDDVVDEIDAASVATPSAAHSELGCALLGHGVAVLVEKPLATTEEGGQALIDAARASAAPLLVGHIERFNPVVAQLSEIVHPDQQVLAVEARRMSAVSGRVVDIDVVTDLMVHDLDIVLDLVRSEVVDVVARGVVHGGAGGKDFATALITFDTGAMAVLTASRITQNRIRQLQVTTDQRFFTVDYPNQELLIYRQGRIGGIGEEPGDASRYILDIGMERVFVPRTEPLVAELAHFLSTCRGEVEPLVSGDQALAALRLVWEIRRQIAGHDGPG